MGFLDDIRLWLPASVPALPAFFMVACLAQRIIPAITGPLIDAMIRDRLE